MTDKQNGRALLIDLVDRGCIDCESLAQMVARWLTEESAWQMLDAHELTPRFTDRGGLGTWMICIPPRP